MSHIESFDSFEEMMDSMARARAQAKTWIQEFQRPLMDGAQHHFLRLVSYSPGDTYLLAGWTFDLDRYYQDSMAKYGKDAEGRSETNYEDRNRRANLVDGYTLTKVFSVITPDGETGDTHVSTMLPISEDVFAQLRSISFDLGLALQDPKLADLVQTWLNEVHVQ